MNDPSPPTDTRGIDLDDMCNALEISAAKNNGSWHCTPECAGVIARIVRAYLADEPEAK